MPIATWVLDPTQSKLGFKIRHILIATVVGHFTAIEASMETVDDAFETANIHFKAETKSINTNNKERDQELKKVIFLDVRRFPYLTFLSTSITKEKEGGYLLNGDLTIKGHTRTIQLETTLTMPTPETGNPATAQLTIKGTINRKGFGIDWIVSKEKGGLLAGEEVTIFGELLFVKQA
jgi:polyisoprenoid-binding protein YceI